MHLGNFTALLSAGALPLPVRPPDMRAQTVLAAVPALAIHALRVLQSNDDGWAELYARSFHDRLIAAGHDAVLSAPADNQSGTGSRDAEPDPRTAACEYGSCPAGTGQPVGTNSSSPRLHWVNSFPVTAMRYGLDTFGPQAWNNGLPDLAVAGPNVGSNVYLQVHFSGTVGAAVYAAQRGIPSIAFSGLTTGNAAWDTTPVPARSLVYAELAGMLVDTLAAQEKPYLPPNVWLNVNFGAVGGEGCTRAADFKWVLSRINIGLFSAPDTPHCGTTRLPSEIDVVNRGCFVSVSVGDARDKSTAPAADQAVVVQKLGNLLSCP